jgi:hypothetical protein
MTKNDYLELLQKNCRDFGEIWANPNPRSFKLTDIGRHVFQHYSGLDSTVIKLPIEKIQTWWMLKLDKVMTSPFWYTIKKRHSVDLSIHLEIFGQSDQAMMIVLYGDLAKFLQNYRL